MAGDGKRLKAVKRKLAWCSLALFVVAAGAFFLWPRDPISQATYDKIRIGMTLEEAEDLVGGPSIGVGEMIDQLVKRRRVLLPAAPLDVLHEGNDWSKVESDQNRIQCWAGMDGGIAVQVGDDGRIIGKRFERWPSPGLLERFRIMLGW
jgi:hypothetical protein